MCYFSPLLFLLTKQFPINSATRKPEVHRSHLKQFVPSVCSQSMQVATRSARASSALPIYIAHALSCQQA